MKELLLNLLDKYSNICKCRNSFKDFYINFRNAKDTGLELWKDEMKMFWNELRSNMATFKIKYDQVSIVIFNPHYNKEIIIKCYWIAKKLVRIGDKLYIRLYKTEVINTEEKRLYLPINRDINFSIVKRLTSSNLSENFDILESCGCNLVSLPRHIDQHAIIFMELEVPIEMIKSISLKDVIK